MKSQRRRHRETAGRKRRVISLFRVVAGQREVYVDQFWHAGLCEPEKALRAAVREYINTPAGHKAFEETCRDFNWGDVIQYVPDRIWRRHGLSPMNTHNHLTVMVDQDEIFRPGEGR